MGLISQQVYEAMQTAGLTDMDFGGYIKAPIYPKGEDGQPDETQEPIGHKHMLRYEEFIAPLIAVVQRQQKQLDALTARVAALKAAEYIRKKEE